MILNRLFVNAARVWAGIVLIAVLLLTVYSFRASAAKPDRTKAETQTASAAGKPPSHIRPGQKLPEGTTLVNSKLLIDMRQEVERQNLEHGGIQWIRAREPEILEIKEKLADSPLRTAVLLGERQSGSTSVFTEFVRSNLGLHDRFYRLNLAKLRSLPEETACSELKKLLAEELPRLVNETTGSQRVYLFIEDLTALQVGSNTQPHQALWEELTDKTHQYFTVIESDPRTFSGLTDPTKNKYQSLANDIGVVHILPPLYNEIFESLVRSTAEIEHQGVGFTMLAAEEAARIAVRYAGKRSPLVFAKQILSEAVREVADDQRAGAKSADRLAAEIKQIDTRRNLYRRDLGESTVAEERTQLTSRITELDRLHAEKTALLDALNRPSGMSQQLAGQELELNSLRVEREATIKNGFAAKSPEVRDLDHQIEQAAYNVTKMENDILLSEDDHGGPPKTAGVRQVLAIASIKLGIKKDMLAANFDVGVKNIDDIGKVVFGQDHVIKAIDNVLVPRASFTYDGRDIEPEEVDGIKRGEIFDSFRTIGNFWFAGKTGVGKTEVAIQLANLLGYKLIQFNMAEFQQSHYVARLTGAPPGFVGYGTPGELVEAVRKNPHAILLLDEIEKAHPDVLRIFLAPLNDGKMQDAQGKEVDFRGIIPIFTSNLAPEITDWSASQCKDWLKPRVKTEELQALAEEWDVDRLRSAVHKLYVQDPKLVEDPIRPELMSRMTNVIVFRDLTTEGVVSIAHKILTRYIRRLQEMHGISMVFTPEAVSAIVKGFNPAEGGRSVGTILDRDFRGSAGRLILDNKAGRGSTIVVGTSVRGKLDFKVTTNQALAAAQAATNDSEPLTETEQFKERLLAKRRGNAEVRTARAATNNLAEKVFEPKYRITERTYRWLKR